MRSYRIGRADTNDIVLADSTVSREHAELSELGGGRFRIKDLGSTYGLAIRQGDAWEKVTESELRHDTALRIGEYETSVAELLRDSDKTVVRARASAPRTAPAETAAPPAPKVPPPERTAPPAHGMPPPAEASALLSEATSPPLRPPAAEAPSAPPKPVPPKPAPPRPARAAAPAGDAATPPQPAPPAFQFLRDLPPEKRPLIWLGAGFAALLSIALVTLILALAL